MSIPDWAKFQADPGSRARRRSRSGSLSPVGESLESRALLTDPTGAIVGAVFEDTNSDGVRDHDEAALPGRTVFLDLNQNGELDQLGSFETWNMSGSGLPINDGQTATSTLVVSNQSGTVGQVRVTLDITHTYDADLILKLRAPNGQIVVLAKNIGGSADHFTGTIFADDALTSITDDLAHAPFTGSFRPFEELSRLAGLDPNGTWELLVEDTAPGDGGTLNSWSLELELLQPAEPLAVTDEQGEFLFAGLDDGSYDIRQITPFGWNETSPLSGVFQVMVTGGGQAAPVEFGSHPAGGAIRGRTWDDLDGDGRWDTGEPALNGQTVQLLDAVTQQVIATTVSGDFDADHDLNIDLEAESGWYRFEHLPAGNYLIRQVLPHGWRQTSPVTSGGPSDEPIYQEPSYSRDQPPTGTKANPVLWYPDLTVDIENGMLDWFIAGNTIRFGQATPNVGHGPMQLIGGPDQGDGTQLVYQRVFNDQGGHTDFEAGYFIFHPEHNHIHFNDYAIYNLRLATDDMDEDGMPEVGDVVRTGQKTSFCLVDIRLFDATLPNSAPDVSGCGCDDKQQISVGWEDIYSAQTEGQEISIAGLPPGQYWLEAVIDPLNHLRETDETNNSGRILVTIGVEAGSHHVTLAENQITAGLNFGSFQSLEVSGQVYADLDRDDDQDSGEVGLVGRVVFLDLNNDGVLNNPDFGDNVANPFAIEPWTLTDKNGQFLLVETEPLANFRPRLIPLANEQFTGDTFPLLSAGSGHHFGPFEFGVFTNTLPELLVEGGSPGTYHPGSAPVPVLSAASVSDVDGDNFNGGSLLISLLNPATGDVLEIREGEKVEHHGPRPRHAEVSFKVVHGLLYVGGEMIGQIVPGTGVGGVPLLATFNNRATAEAIEEVLQHVTFVSTSTNPVIGVRTIQFVLSDGNGGVSAPATSNLTVLSEEHNPPVLDLLDAPALYTGGETGVRLGQGATLDDPDGTLAKGKLTIAITQNRQKQDRLELRDSEPDELRIKRGKIYIGDVLVGKLSTRKKGGELQIQFTSATTIEQAQLLLSRVLFIAPVPTAVVPHRTVEVTLSDGTRRGTAKDTREVATPVL